MDLCVCERWRSVEVYLAFAGFELCGHVYRYWLPTHSYHGNCIALAKALGAFGTVSPLVMSLGTLGTVSPLVSLRAR